MALTTKQIENLKKPGRYADGDGLLLQVRSATNKSFVFRYKRDGKEHFVGLGSTRVISLADARRKAMDLRMALHDGRNPLAEKRVAEAELQAAKNATPKHMTLGQPTAQP